MEQTGEYRIAAPRQQVWLGLNDPTVLARCIDGCQSMEKLADDRFDAAVKARIGPVNSLFRAELTLRDVQPPSSYVIDASVKGGPAGFAKGKAEVNLEQDGDATLLRYAVTASVGGKVAQVGSRLIDGAARKMADDFFHAFGREVSGEAPTRTVAPPGIEQPQPSVRPYQPGGQWKIWAVVFVALIIALALAF